MSDYTDLVSRLKAYLHDSGSLIYAASYLDEGISQALDTISNVMGSSPALTITGFRSASSTTLPSNLFSVFIQGSAAFCFLGRSGKRSEITNLDQRVPESVITIAELNLDQFKKSLESIRTSVMNNSSVPPYPSVIEDTHWPIDDLDGETIY